MKRCLALLALLVSAAAARADVLAVWNSAGADASGSYAPTNTATGAAVSNLAIGSGLEPYNSPGNTFCANGYTQTTLANAASAGDFWTVSVSPASEDYELNLSSLVYTFRHTSKGPQYWMWQVSTDNDTWTAVGGLVTSTNTAYEERTVDLSGASALQNLSGTAYFRLVAWGGATNKTATGCFGQKKDVLLFNGTAVSLAAPPTISFSGASSVGLSNTLEVAVSVSPTGSGIASCTSDLGQAGSFSYADGVASATPTRAAAVGNTYTITAVATNKYGASTNTFDFAVTRYVPDGALFIDFEDLGTTSSSYVTNTLSVSGTSWLLENGLTKMGTNDHVNGENALRMRHSWSEGSFASSGAVASNGLATISFAYATYGNYVTGSTVSVEVSADGSDWLGVGEVETGEVHEPTVYETPYIGIAEPLFVRLRTAGQDACNIDDILLSPYAADPDVGEYEAFLLRYNITPGDSLTGEDDDYDGDGVSNADEKANGTNPFDKSDS